MQDRPIQSPGRGLRFPALLGPAIAFLALVLSCADTTTPTSPDEDNGNPPAPPAPTFPTFSEVIDEMTEAATQFPDIVEMVNLTEEYGTPQTHLGQDLFAVKISDNVSQEEDEPAFLMVAAHHGNEIGTPVVALDAIARLTDGYGVNITISRLVNEYETWIVPVWNVDGYPDRRRNERPNGNVDLNRNYPFLWSTDCSGSTSTGSGNYKGPSAGSEPETQTMMALSEDRRFTKVLDLHSSGRVVVFGYRCSPHQLSSYLEEEAVALSEASSYNGEARQPSAEGEHYHWQLGNFSNYAFLTEISNTQSPSYADAVVEAARVWPGTIWMLQRPIPVWGHVRDATSGEPLSTHISYVENPFTQGEQNTSEPRFGRYHAFLPPGEHTLRFSHAGYVTQEVPVTVTAAGTRLEVALVREVG